MNEITLLARFLRSRNEIDRRIAFIIGYPTAPGPIGEFIASKIFGIELMEYATQKGFDGHFASGPLAGRTVSVELYGKQDDILDDHPEEDPDYFLVITSPRTAHGMKSGTSRPFIIEHIYLFDAKTLLWEEAEIYPVQRNKIFPLTEEQRSLLHLFNSSALCRS